LGILDGCSHLTGRARCSRALSRTAPRSCLCKEEKMMWVRRRSQGFTLIELLVVIAIM
jgi:type II secretory pathway pseudopilin PulG